MSASYIPPLTPEQEAELDRWWSAPKRAVNIPSGIDTTPVAQRADPIDDAPRSRIKPIETACVACQTRITISPTDYRVCDHCRTHPDKAKSLIHERLNRLDQADAASVARYEALIDSLPTDRRNRLVETTARIDALEARARRLRALADADAQRVQTEQELTALWARIEKTIANPANIVGPVARAWVEMRSDMRARQEERATFQAALQLIEAMEEDFPF